MIKFPSSVIIAAFFIIIAGMFFAATLVTQILMTIFISVICYAPIAWLQNMKVPKSLAIVIVFVSIIAITIGFGTIIGSSLSSFTENLPRYQKNLTEMTGEIHEMMVVQGFNFSFDSFSGLSDPSKIMDLTAKVLGQLGSFMGNAATIMLLALFLLFEVDSISDKIKAIVKGSDISVSYLNKIIKSIRHYLSIKTATSLMTGFFIWIFLIIAGIEYAVLWALLAFLLNYIPNIGSIIAMIPPMIFSFIQLGFSGLIWTVVIFVSVNMIIGNIVEPKMLGKGMGLSTLVVFLSLLFWGFILGIVGAFLSIPLTMAIKIMCEQNPETKWIAILLGTSEDAGLLMESKDNIRYEEA